jgi:hypothetical protein
LYPTAHAGDTLTSDGAPSVASGSEKEAITACSVPSYREKVDILADLDIPMEYGG